MTSTIIKDAVNKALGYENVKYEIEIVEDVYNIIDLNEYIYDTEESFVIVDFDRRFKSYNEDNDWYESARNIITDICCYSDMENSDDVQELADNYKISTEVIMEINDIIEDKNFYEYSSECLVDILNKLYPDQRFNWQSIKGYSQGEYAEVIYKVEEIRQEDIQLMEDIYFGKYKIVYLNNLENDDNFVADIITDSDLWKIENDYKALCERFDVPVGETIIEISGKMVEVE